MLKNFKTNRLYCFSPPVMIATFLIEIVAAILLYLRYQSTTTRQLIIAILLCLGIFQLAEANVCEGWMELGGDFWSRVGFISISLLPPLGVHLATKLFSKKPAFARVLTMLAYLSCGVFVGMFLLLDGSITLNQCLGNYVIFKMLADASVLYGFYYYGWLLIGVWLCFVVSKTQSPQARLALKWLGIGYLLFMLPTTLVNIIDPNTIAGIPSIMCGFAVLLAITLLTKVAPLSLKKK